MDPLPFEIISYLLFGGFVQLAAALLLAPVFFALGRFLAHRPFRRLLRAYLIFNGFLLFWGCLANYIWLCLALDKWYVSADRLVDFLPFIPVGQWVLDQSLGPIHGHFIAPATLWQLQIVWLALAIPVWLLTYFSTIRLVRIPSIPVLIVIRGLGSSIAGFGLLCLPGIREGFRSSGRGLESAMDVRSQVLFGTVLLLAGAAVVLGSFAIPDKSG